MQLLYKAQYLEKKSKESEAALQFVNQQLEELERFNLNLEDFAKIKKPEEKEILAQLGNRVFAKTQLKETQLYVDVGADIMIKKSPEDTQKTIQNQIKKLKQAKVQITAQLEQCTQSLFQIMAQMQESQKEKTKESNNKKKPDKAKL